MVARVLNLTECIKKFGDIRNIKLAPIFEKITRRVYRTAQDLCPIDTGELYLSIKMEGIDNNYEKGGRVFTAKEYAIPVEFGWKRGKSAYAGANLGRGYMRPAIDINKELATKDFERYLTEKLSIICKK